MSPTEAKKNNPAAQQFTQTCLSGLETAKRLLPQIIATKAPRTVDNTLGPYNELLMNLANSAATAGLFSEVHPEEAIRDAARDCEQETSKFATELGLHQELYAAIKAVDVAKADAETKRFVMQTLRDYRRSGIELPQAQRDRLKEIDEELTKLGQQFSKNIAEDVRAIELSPNELAGLPADFIASHKPGANGKVKITTDYPDYNPFITYAENDAARAKLYVLFRSRGDAGNEGLLQSILTLRAEKAKLLGYATWADYITEDKMIKSSKAAGDFIAKVWKLAEPRAKKDYAELLAQLQKHQTDAKAVGDWQKAWLENEVKKDKYQVDGSEVRNYFVFDTVLQGLLAITSTIYDIQYVPVAASEAQPWHASVKVYDVMRGKAKLGRIFLDLHPRDGKYKHAAQFTYRDGVKDQQLPEGVLVCNFPDPATSQGPALMEHDDVVTMFHEFGHLMHHILGGHHRWIRHAGVATEWDFVEAPSQMFEEWAWNYDTLARFAKHHQTGEVIPKTLVEKMVRADKFGLGTQTVQQMFYAAISLEFHRTEPQKLDQLATVKALQTKYTPFAYVDGTKFHASFGHLVGYSAMYYTYMWSKVIAKDLLSPFNKGLMDTKTTHAYRDKILAAGGTNDAAVLVKNFLGREYNFKAFDKYLRD